MGADLTLTRRDALWTVGLFVAAVLTRAPFRSEMLYHWDSVNFALATQRYDLTISQPHAPGYLLYVLAGRALNLFTHDANAAYVWLSVVFSGIAVAALYLLGRAMFGGRVGVAAALLGITSPAVWFHGEVALTYIVEAALVTLLAWACYRLMRAPSLRRALIATLLLGMAGGVRQTTLALMLPLWLVALWRVGWRDRIVAAAALVAAVLAWLAPTILLTGGLATYLAVSQSIGGGVLHMFNEGESGGALAAAGRVTLYVFYGLLGGGLAGLAWLAIAAMRSLRSPQRLAAVRAWSRDARVQVLAAWLIPSLVLWAPLARAPGHIFLFLPALILLSARGLVGWSEERLPLLPPLHSARSRLYALLGATVLTNALFFFTAPPTLFDTDQTWAQRVAFSVPARSALLARDLSLAARIDYIRSHFPPETAALLSSGVDFRHPDWYLADYRRFGWSGDAGIVTLTPERGLPATVATLVIFGEDMYMRAALQNILEAANGAAGVLRQAALPDGSTLQYLERGPDGEFGLPQAWLQARD
jgi:hypothetical protein